MTCSSAKLYYYYLEPYMVEKYIKPILYYLKLFSTLQKLHLVFPIVKLIIVSGDSIFERYSSLYINLVIINRKEEWKKNSGQLLVL